MACARPVVHGGGAAPLVAGAGCGPALDDDDPESLAAAAAALVHSAELDALGRRGRRFAAGFDRAHCDEREIACVREVVEIVRAGRRVAPGIHERMLPPALDILSEA